MKFLRKPYLSAILVSLIFFASCSQYGSDVEVEEVNEFMSLTSYAERHIEITDRLYKILENERNIDINVLLSEIEIDESKVSETLAKANFTEFNEISKIFDKLNLIGNVLVESNPYLKNIDENEIERIISKEIDKQVYLDDSNHELFHSCDRAYEQARDGCGDNYAISLAVVAISGAVSFGVGTAIGAVGATGVLVYCLERARGHYNDCKNNDNP